MSSKSLLLCVFVLFYILMYGTTSNYAEDPGEFRTSQPQSETKSIERTSPRMHGVQDTTYVGAVLDQTEADIIHDNDDGPETGDRSILNLVDKKRYEWKNMFNDLDGSWCVGSSHGWLVILDREGVPLILDPSSSVRINFPPITPAFTDPKSPNFIFFKKTFIVKAVVMMSSSDSASSSHILVIIYDQIYCKLAYCKGGIWFHLSDDKKQSYSDIVVHKSCLYALTEYRSVEVWDLFQENPKKTFSVSPLKEQDSLANNYLGHKFSSQLYLVIDGGKILMVERHIGNFVNPYGEVLEDEGDILTSEFIYPIVSPYRTLHFSVYMLDLARSRWKNVRSLDDQVLFLGGNESVSVDAKDFLSSEANSIYFTDDRWFEMHLDYTYGGHDSGVFRMKDRSIDPLLPFIFKVDPPPMWVVPFSS